MKKTRRQISRAIFGDTSQEEEEPMDEEKRIRFWIRNPYKVSRSDPDPDPVQNGPDPQHWC